MTSIQDFLRYNKQIMLPEVGNIGQQKLTQARVLLVGAGGLGCPILQYLTAVGVGTIGIVDFDDVAIHNLHRQILYTDNDCKKPKVLVAKEALKKLNPNVQCIIFKEELTANNAEHIINQFDFVIDGSDNFTTRYLINDSCVTLKKPLVYGSILKFEGQIAIFNHHNSKNLRDIFPEPPNPSDVPNCSVNGVLGTLPGIVGTIMAHEALKLIIGLDTLHNQLIIINTMNWEFKKIKF